MIDKDKVYALVVQNGPVLPRDVVKEVGADTFIIGAILSQLVDSKQIRITSTKIGGSPVYYSSGQEPRLQELYKYLHEKEKRAFDMLKQNNILVDTELEPVIRVALRNIRDFAKPLEVNINGQKQIYWKWYLLSNADAEVYIKNRLSTIKVAKEPSAELKETQQVLEPEQKKPTSTEPDFLVSVQTLFREKKIEILQTETIKKNSEYEVIALIPSPVGNLMYFCKLKNKKKCTDKDLSSAYVQGQMHKLPILFVTSGDLTKKAKQMLNQEFKMISIMQI